MAWGVLDEHHTDGAERFRPHYGERDALAATALLTAATGADLVVVGSRGLRGFAELLPGSVGHKVVQHAECTVVVIPEEG